MSESTELVAFGPDANCTLDLCPLEFSVLRYRPSPPANGIFLAIFALSMVIHVIQGIKWKTWGFLTCMIIGCMLEIGGYVGRLLLYHNPFSFPGFLMQIIFITVAPVFFCAAIYVLLYRIIMHIEPSISRFNPRLFYWIFIPSDVISLILQGVGGGISCVSTSQNDIQKGANVSLAGLIFQVVALVLFCALFLDYVVSCLHHVPRHKLNRNMRIFLVLLFSSVLFILIRCIYRIVELKDGYFSDTFRDEDLFIALESVIMCIGVICLNCGHPGPVFRGYHEHMQNDKSCIELVPQSVGRTGS